MVKVLFALATLAIAWLLPAESLAQDRDETIAADSAETADLLVSVEAIEESFGVREHRLRVVPRGTPQPDVEQPYRRPRPAWPGEHLRDGYRFADAYAFPELFPGVSGSYQAQLGSGPSDESLFSHRVDLELYALHVGLSLYDSIDGDRDVQQIVDVDARIPFRFGETLRLALLPGLSFDAARVRDDAEVRLQGVFGWGVEIASLQARLGYTVGPRPGGLLLPLGARPVSAPAALFGALAALRVVPAVELRAEVAGEAASNDEADRLSLLPGAAFYPLGDERVEMGLAAVVESRARDFDLSDPAVGALLRLELAVY